MQSCLSPYWHNPQQFSGFQLQANWRRILLDTTSTTKRFRREMQNYQLDLLTQTWGSVLLSEKKHLNLNLREKALTREVNIFGNDHLLMFARTVIPPHSLVGKNKFLYKLSNRPLGEILFKDPKLIRTPFQLARITPNTYFYKKMELYVKDLPQYFWARRSIFFLNSKPLLLTEVFSPWLLNFKFIEKSKKLNLC